MLRRFTAVVTAAAGLTALFVSPASASPTVNWQPVNTNPNWRCDPYTEHPAYANAWGGVKFKACIVMSNISGTKAQAVLVVQNAANQDVHIEKGRVIFESASGGDVWCAPSNLAAGATAGCYAPSVLALHCNVTTQATTELTLLGRKDRTTKGGEYVPC